ncbi:MAG: SRPBCC domain-containing protein [Rhodobacteraceae bacterium]|nr:SRPBCC domain-containing protein [Paracoccaceae bacterium]
MCDKCNDPVLRLTRDFAASQDRLWSAWTDPAALTDWFTPEGATATLLRHELRPGGMLLSRLDMPGADPSYSRFVYREVAPNRRLSWLHGFGDAEGNPKRHPMAADFPLLLVSTLVFAPKDGGTAMTLTWQPHQASADEVHFFAQNLDGMRAGWAGPLDQLARYLAG